MERLIIALVWLICGRLTLLWMDNTDNVFNWGERWSNCEPEYRWRCVGVVFWPIVAVCVLFAQDIVWRTLYGIRRLFLGGPKYKK